MSATMNADDIFLNTDVCKMYTIGSYPRTITINVDDEKKNWDTVRVLYQGNVYQYTLDELAEKVISLLELNVLRRANEHVVGGESCTGTGTSAKEEGSSSGGRTRL